MCDQNILDSMGPGKSTGFNRRQFNRIGAMLGVGAGLSACAPMASAGNDGALIQRDVTFAAPGGTMDGVFIAPAQGAHPAVILWPDIAGLRPAKIEMGRRLAEAGYAVLVGNPYYRSVAGEQFADFAAWREGGAMETVAPWRAVNTPEAIAETYGAVVEWLDAQDEVDTARGIGTQGYCMTGSWTIRGAAAVPDRVKAAASFHGGGLVGEEADSPVNLLDDLAPDAHVLVAIGKDDDASAPDDKVALAAAGDAAATDVTVEVYGGDHGWTVLDSPVYDQAEAERAWAALLALYSNL